MQTQKTRKQEEKKKGKKKRNTGKMRKMDNKNSTTCSENYLQKYLKWDVWWKKRRNMTVVGKCPKETFLLYLILKDTRTLPLHLINHQLFQKKPSQGC